jgi:hypothetical protein
VLVLQAQLDQRTAAGPSEPDVTPNSSSNDLPAEDAASLSAHNAELEASLAAAQQQIRQLQQEAATSASSLADLQAQNASLAAANADWAARLEDARAELATQASAELATAADLAVKLAVTESELQVAGKQLEEAKARLRTASASAGSAEVRGFAAPFLGRGGACSGPAGDVCGLHHGFTARSCPAVPFALASPCCCTCSRQQHAVRLLPFPRRAAVLRRAVLCCAMAPSPVPRSAASCWAEKCACGAVQELEATKHLLAAAKAELAASKAMLPVSVAAAAQQAGQEGSEELEAARKQAAEAAAEAHKAGPHGPPCILHGRRAPHVCERS